MKPKQGAIIIGLILALLLTLVMVAMPDSANLYVAYGFALAGVVALVAGVFAVDEKDSPATYAIIGQTGWFLPVSLFLSAIVLFLQGFAVFTLPVIWHVIVQLVPLSVVGMRIAAIYTGKQYIERIDAQTAAKTGRLTDLTASVNALLSRMDNLPEDSRTSAKVAIKKVSEALRYSDPMSTASVQALDEQIEEGIAQMEQLCVDGQADDLIKACEMVCAKIRERSERLKNSK